MHGRDISRSNLDSYKEIKNADIPFKIAMRNFILIIKQECIPVGCVPPASVAVLGGMSAHRVSVMWVCLPRGYTPSPCPLHAGIHTPWSTAC